MKEENINLIYVKDHKFGEEYETLLIDVNGEHCDIFIEMNDIFYTKGYSYYVLKDDKYEELEYCNKDVKQEFLRLSEEGNLYFPSEKRWLIKKKIIDSDILKNRKEEYDGENAHIEGKEMKRASGKESTIRQKELIELKYIFYDYETVVDYSREDVLIPISLGFVEVDKTDIETLSITDRYDVLEEQIEAKKKARKDCMEKLETKVVVRCGEDCTESMYDVIRNSVNTMYTLVSFNGAKFDHYLLYKSLLKICPDVLSKVFFVKNDLLNFKIQGVHELFDLHKYIPSSLKEACKDFNLGEYSKKEIDFNEIQKRYDDEVNEEIFLKKLREDDKFIEYQKYDILSLLKLFVEYKNSLSEIMEHVIKTRQFEMTDYKTIGGLMKEVMNEHVDTKNINIPIFKKSMIKYYKDLIKYRVGGRVDLFNGIQKIEGQICSPDLSGSYPYNMAINPVYYPCGEIKEVNTFEEMPEDKIGFFYVDNINQRHLKLKIIPEKNKDGTNDWKTMNILNGYFLSIVKINMLKKLGCDIKIRNGIYFTDKIKSCELFEFILGLMKFKTDQDIKKEKGEDYNNSIRTCIKSLMLILSGKLAEQLYCTKTMIMSENEMKMMGLTCKSMELKSIIGDKGLVVCDIGEEKALQKSQPIYLSTLIYDYSHEYMINSIWGKINYKDLIYCDTDSCKLRKETFELWKEEVKDKEVPHWKEVEEYDSRYKTSKMYADSNIDKVIGSFQDEYKTNEINISYWLQKKSYFVGNTNNELMKNNKMIFKGIKENDKYIDGNLLKVIKDNYINFFENLYRKRTVDVLCSSIHKDKNQISLVLKKQTKTIRIIDERELYIKREICKIKKDVQELNKQIKYVNGLIF